MPLTNVLSAEQNAQLAAGELRSLRTAWAISPEHRRQRTLREALQRIEHARTCLQAALHTIDKELGE